MRRGLILISLLLVSNFAFGATSQKPDYSRDTILKILHDGDRDDAPVKLSVGMAELRTGGTRYHFAYLPFLKSLPYAGPYGARFLPNPFVLTGTEYAWRPHQYYAVPDDYENSREYQSEYKRVAKMLRKQHVVVK